jgi:nucleolar MIF4G domain-containing protein 1
MLRARDPTAIKQIITELSTQLKKKTTSELSPRAKFMVESITDLKNNKKRSGGDAELQSSRLSKFLVGFYKSRGSRYAESNALTVSLSDIRNVKTNGRWWVVGAAWTGREATATKDVDDKDSLDTLAREHGMNTEIRRSIFIVLMGSEVYPDLLLSNRTASMHLNGSINYLSVKSSNVKSFAS